jgi:outer membrane immunogenic protein
MKHRLLATVAIGALSVASASAADLRRPVTKGPIPPPAPACAQFGGFYVGGQVGSTIYDHHWQDLDSFAEVEVGGLGDIGHTTNTRKWGWNAGVVGGYNWQTRCTVFGVEADWNWTDTKTFKRLTVGDSEDVTVSSKMKWFGTVRARTGVVVDNLLIYVTGGLAWARFDRTFDFFGGKSDEESFSVRNTRWGWTAGVGTEWAFSGNVSLKADVLYMSFANKETSFTSTFFAPGDRFRFDSKDDVWVSRIGLHFRFGGAPLVASY